MSGTIRVFVTMLCSKFYNLDIFTLAHALTESRSRLFNAFLLASVNTRDNDLVPIVPRGLVDQKKIRVGVRQAERALAPDVIRIMYSCTLDWTGEQSLFFRIVISDAASAPNRLRETTQRIIAKVLHEIKAEELGLQTYFNFRSASEQAMLRDPFWERQ